MFLLALLVQPTKLAYSQETGIANSNSEPIKKQAVGRTGSTHISDIVFSEVSGEELLADFYRPSIQGPHPIVLLIHGGGWITGTRHQSLSMQTG